MDIGILIVGASVSASMIFAGIMVWRNTKKLDEVVVLKKPVQEQKSD